jgi:hypothetical protein
LKGSDFMANELFILLGSMSGAALAILLPYLRKVKIENRTGYSQRNRFIISAIIGFFATIALLNVFSVTNDIVGVLIGFLLAYGGTDTVTEIIKYVEIILEKIR